MNHRSTFLTLALLALLASLRAQTAQPLPDSLFAHIVSPGRHQLLANQANQLGQGETVDISTDYYMARMAVTNQEWQLFIQATGQSAPRYWTDGAPPAGKERHPVVWVSAVDAEAYCRWLEQQYPGYTFRLPTQGEWEYAACGSQRTVWPWGDAAGTSYMDGRLTSRFNYNAVVGAYVLQTPDRLATYNNPRSTRYGQQERVGDIFTLDASGSVRGWINHTDYTGFVYTDIFTQINDAGGHTCAVDDYPEGASPWGCLNMSGNCWEWTSTLETATNGAEKGQTVNVIKGGSWYATASSCRISYRGEGRRASGTYATVGIRVVAERQVGTALPAARAAAPSAASYSLSGVPAAPSRGVTIVRSADGARKRLGRFK